MKSEDALGWKVRIGFGAGDLAQNLVFSAVGTYLLFFSTDVVGLAPSAMATLFFVVQLADALWNPFVGVFIDGHSPPWGKYRSYLVMAGIPFAAFAVMCFANPFGGAWKMIYACAAYAGFTLLFTLMNVAYGALSASLSRDMDEITTLTAVRIFLANAGCLAAMAGVPMLVAALAGKGVASSGHMSLFMACGMLPSFVFMPRDAAVVRVHAALTGIEAASWEEGAFLCFCVRRSVRNGRVVRFEPRGRDALRRVRMDLCSAVREGDGHHSGDRLHVGARS